MARPVQHHTQPRYHLIYLGELDDKGLVALPQNINSQFDNGYVVGQVIKKFAHDNGKKTPNALTTVKNDTSKNTKLTNWNFIWYHRIYLGWHSRASASRFNKELRS